MAAYRITVETLDPAPGEGGHESLSFFASTPHDIFATVNALRSRVDCSACTAAKLAVAISLLDQSIQEWRHEAFFTPLHQAAVEVLRSLESVPVETLAEA